MMNPACVLVLMLLGALVPSAGEDTLLDISELSEASRSRLQSSYWVESMEELLSLENQKIDVSVAALMVEKEHDPRIDVGKYLKLVDRLAATLVFKMSNKITAERAVTQLNRTLFSQYSYVGSSRAHEPVQGFLSNLLDSGKGNSLALSTLYIAVGRRIGLPLVPVKAGSVFFIRFAGDNISMNIEPLSGGQRFEDIIDSAPTQGRGTRGEAQKTLDNKELITLFQHKCEAARARMRLHEAMMSVYGFEEGSDKTFKADQFLQIGLDFYGQARYSLAVEAFSRFIEKEPDNYIGFLYRGATQQINAQTLAKQKQDKKIPSQVSRLHYHALDDLERAAEKNPSSPYVQLALSCSYFEYDMYYNGMVSQTLANTFLGASPEAMENESPDSVLLQNIVEAAEAVFQKKGMLYAKSQEHYDKEEYDQAAELLTQALKLDPDSSCLFTERGMALYKNGDLEDALRDLDHVITEEPTDRRAWKYRGYAHFDLKQYEQAIHDLSRAMELGSETVSVYCTRGHVYNENGQPDKALADYNRAIEIDSSLWEPVFSRGNIWLRKGDYEKALADFQKAIECDPLHPWTYHNRSMVWLELDHFDAALEDLNRAIDLDAGDCRFWAERGWLYYKYEHYDEAIADYTRAIDLRPDVGHYFLTRAKAYIDSSRYSTALEDLEQAKALGEEIDPEWEKEVRDKAQGASM